MVGIPQPAAYKPIVRSDNGDLRLLLDAQVCTVYDLTSLCGLDLDVRSVSRQGNRYLIAKIEPQ
ncbi:MAG TPA: hypothetical protein VFJ46_07860 [Xanthobacteraceae bacterium]|nr:hypothetical protein [Xanthobacteraceae bacterium]